MERVPYDDLDFPDWDHGYTYNGESFTGIAYELFADGRLRCEVEFRGGIEAGVWKEWHPNGMLSQEAHLDGECGTDDAGSGTPTVSSPSTASTSIASAFAAGAGTRPGSRLRSSPSIQGM
jgi:hypothetical protein